MQIKERKVRLKSFKHLLEEGWDGYEYHDYWSVRKDNNVFFDNMVLRFESLSEADKRRVFHTVMKHPQPAKPWVFVHGTGYSWHPELFTNVPKPKISLGEKNDQ